MYLWNTKVSGKRHITFEKHIIRESLGFQTFCKLPKFVGIVFRRFPKVFASRSHVSIFYFKFSTIRRKISPFGQGQVYGFFKVGVYLYKSIISIGSLFANCVILPYLGNFFLTKVRGNGFSDQNPLSLWICQCQRCKLSNYYFFWKKTTPPQCWCLNTLHRVKNPVADSLSFFQKLTLLRVVFSFKNGDPVSHSGT